jgi:hypothetical protein
MTKRATTCLVIILILINLSLIPTINASFYSNIRDKIKPILPIYGMDIVNSTYEDGLYNGTNFSYPLEWYYFDTVLSDGYSVEFHIICGPTDTLGIVTPMINIYKDSKLLFHSATYQFMNKFNSDSDEMIIQFDDQTIIKGKMNNEHEWLLFLNYSVDNASVNLKFSSFTESWKGNVLNMWWWAVLIPNSFVSGTITLDNQTTQVKGNGYVEHAWDGAIPTVWGWYWGKFVGKNYSAIWSQIYKNPLERHVVMVLNILNGSYYNIPYQDISIRLKDFIFYDGWFIPSGFEFSVDTNNIHISLTAKAQSIIHQTSIATFNYWRYHVHIIGSITYQGTLERIDNMQIMDLTRFY